MLRPVLIKILTFRRPWVRNAFNSIASPVTYTSYVEPKPFWNRIQFFYNPPISQDIFYKTCNLWQSIKTLKIFCLIVRIWKMKCDFIEKFKSMVTLVSRQFLCSFVLYLALLHIHIHLRHLIIKPRNFFIYYGFQYMYSKVSIKRPVLSNDLVWIFSKSLY